MSVKKVLRRFQQNEVIAGFLGSGKTRVLLLESKDSPLVSDALKSLCSEIISKDTRAYWTTIDAEKIKSPRDACSQFARNLKSNSCEPFKIANFAKKVGMSTSTLKPDGKGSLTIDEAKKAFADSLTSSFSELVGTNAPKLLLCINGVDRLSENLLEWFSNELNHSMRSVPQFRNTRFLFTANSHEQRLRNFFDQFGFEQVHSYELAEVGDLKSTQAKEPAFSKRLINEKNSANLGNKLVHSMSKDQQDMKKFMSSYSEDEQKYLAVLSYPKRASRYSLEHFVDSRTAALAFNWLKRSPALRSVHSSGDLILNDAARDLSRAHHAAENPESAIQWNEIASVLDLFFDQFPHIEDHKIAINLQAFSLFNQKLLNQLFNRDELSEIELFIQRNEGALLEDGKNLFLTEDAKLVTRRYMEISERIPLPGLLDRVREIWLEDQEHFSVKKLKLDEERKNLTTEIEDTLKQIVKLNELKDKLLEDFKNPNRIKREKEYSFSTSKALIFLGLVTCGASVMFDSLGTYHAACGLAVTLFGFFWPNVELKKATSTNDGPKSNLAIETQQRSLKHRIAGLGNRTGVMKANLGELDKQMENLGEVPPPPYLELAEESD